MALLQPLLPLRYISPLNDLLLTIDAPARREVLRHAGLDGVDFDQVEDSIDMDQFDALIASAEETLNRSDLGFELGRHSKLTHHKPLLLPLSKCRTLEQLLRLLCHYQRLITTCFSLHYQRNETQAVYICRPSAYISHRALACFEELYAVSMARGCLDLFGERMQRLDVHLSIPEPSHLARYDTLRPVRFHFSSESMPAVRFDIPAKLLDLPLEWMYGENPAITGHSPEELIQMQQELPRNRYWGDWVGLILREAEGCQPSGRQLAELLNVCPQTLSRQLAREGLNLRQLGKEIRYQRACGLLAETEQSITHIAYRLGYTDSSNFSHAFRTMSGGLSPKDWRAKKLKQKPV
ncbi:AraC family transcriptional regulator ligand-binding domain-containing protein [Pseudomonadota bacterium]